MNRIFVLVLVVVLSGLQGCGRDDDPVTAESADSAERALRMLFVEQEAGVDPFRTRVLVTADYLRMDDGQDGSDYILYDRKTREVAAVSHVNRSVLKIYHHELAVQPPVELDYAERSEVDPNAPSVGGQTPEHHVFSTNGEVCFEVMAVPGLLEEARVAMDEYLQTLATEQALNLDKTPPGMQTPCMLSNMVFAPTRHLAHGFPIQEWDCRGYSRTLLDYGEIEDPDPFLFVVPEEYRSFSVNELGAQSG
jgi:hypothetical protein